MAAVVAEGADPALRAAAYEAVCTGLRLEVALLGAADTDCPDAALLGVTVAFDCAEPPVDSEVVVDVFTGVAFGVLVGRAVFTDDVEDAGDETGAATFAVVPDPEIFDLGTARFTSTWHNSHTLYRDLWYKLIPYLFPVNNMFSLCTHGIYASLTFEYNKTKSSRFVSFSVKHYFRREHTSIFLKIITKFSCK